MHEETGAQEEVSLRDYLDLLRRRSAIIIQTCIAALVIGIVVAVMQSPVYKSSGRLLVTPPMQSAVMKDASDPLSSIAGAQNMHTIETQLEVLMNGKLLGEAYQAAGVAPGDPRVHVSVGRANEMVDIIDLSTEAHKPEIAADVTNNLMDLYIKEEHDGRTGDTTQAIKYAEKSLKDAQTLWEQAGQELQKYSLKSGTTDQQQSLASSATQGSSLAAKGADLQQTIVGNQAFIDKTKAHLAALPKTIRKEMRVENPQIRALDAELIKARSDYAAVLQKVTPDNAQAKPFKANIDTLTKERASLPAYILNTERVTNPEILDTESKLRALEAQMAQINAAYAKNAEQQVAIQATQVKLAKDNYPVARLQQQAKSAQELVSSMTKQLSDLKLRESAEPHPITVLGKASINPRFVRPNRPVIIFMSALAGLFLGVCFALLAEFMDDRVNAPEDARRLLGAPALGYIPRIDKEEQRLLSADRGGSLLESYRVLRSNVRFAAVGEPLNSMMVTSTTPGEGKSLTAANLAIAMALDGRKVILVDADLRRPTVHEKFGVRNTPGLTNVLVGSMSIDKALQDTDVENLKLMTSGPIPPNPAELLNSRAFEQVHEMLKERADLVIFDSPPCLSVADAQVLAANVDGLVYVVQLGSTKKSALKHGHELLKQAHAKILGVVYNKVQVDGRRNDYYYGYYSYYHKTELTGKGGSGNGKNGQSSEWEGMISQSAEAQKAQEANALPANAPEGTESKEG